MAPEIFLDVNPRSPRPSPGRIVFVPNALNPNRPHVGLITAVHDDGTVDLDILHPVVFRVRMIDGPPESPQLTDQVTAYWPPRI
jgi:hypothetical protein